MIDIIVSGSDPGAIQTHDLQNRNLTLYSLSYGASWRWSVINLLQNAAKIDKIYQYAKNLSFFSSYCVGKVIFILYVCDLKLKTIWM